MTRKTAEMVFVLFALGSVWLSLDSWLSSRDAERKFKNASAVEQKLIAESDAANRQQENELKTLLKQTNDLKAKTKTPFQIVKELPKYLSLPVPITLANSEQTGCEVRTDCAGTSLTSKVHDGKSSVNSIISPPESPRVTAPKPSSLLRGNLDAKLPVQDLRPLFNFVQDCRTCDAELDAARKMEGDDAIKLAALTRERDLALRVEKRSYWRRFRQGVVLFSLGAMVGYAAAHR